MQTSGKFTITSATLSAVLALFTYGALSSQATIGPTSPSATTSPTAVGPDFVMHAEVLPSPNQFRHEQFSLRPVTEVVIDFSTASDINSKQSYESFWYHDGKALGLDRKQQFQAANKKVSIEFGMTPVPGEQETKAAAGAIMRLLVELYLKGNTVSSVAVPPYALPLIETEMQNKGAKIAPSEGDLPSDAKIFFRLHAAGSNAAHTVYFD
jgi:hypothetical protein